MPLPLNVGAYLPERRVVARGEGEVVLSPSEAALLEYLAARPGQVVAQAVLLREVWGYAASVESRTVYTTVGRLRTKIELDPHTPRHLIAVAGAGYRFEPGTTSNLPPPRTDVFIGREAEVHAIEQALDEARLVTIKGPGGIGKTRLAEVIATRRVARTPGGTWWCDLSAVREASEVASVAARSLGALVSADPVAAIRAVLASRGPSLVVLDNAEQVADAVARLVLHTLTTAPNAVFLVTSRVPLRLAGERLFPLSPLAVQSDGSALFAARGRQVRPEFDIDAHRHDVEALVAALDGIPLAIELAAARVRVSTPAQLVARLARPLDLLARAPADAPDRHRTMRAAIEGSWHGLGAPEAAALGQLSVFHGGFELGAAEEVVDLRAWPGVAVIDVVQNLVDDSLISASTTGIDIRFSMYELVRAFAAERLADSGAEPDVADRHARHYARYGDRAHLRALHGQGAKRAVQQLERERANLTIALSHAIARGLPDSAAGVAIALARLFRAVGPATEGPRIAARLAPLAVGPAAAAVEGARVALLALSPAPGLGAEVRRIFEAHPDASPDVRAVVARELVRIDLGSPRTERWVELAREADAASGHQEPDLLLYQAIRLHELGDPGALTAYERSLAASLAAGDRLTEADTHGSLAIFARQEGRFADARTHYDAALAGHLALGQERRALADELNLGVLALHHGEPDEARARFERVIADVDRVGSTTIAMLTWDNLASVALLQDDAAEALVLVDRALAVGESAHTPIEHVLHLRRAAALAALGRREDSLAALARGGPPAGATPRQQVEATIGEADVRLRLGDVADARRLGAAGVAAADAQELGQEATLARGILGEAIARSGAAAEGAALLAEARAVAERAGWRRVAIELGQRSAKVSTVR